MFFFTTSVFFRLPNNYVVAVAAALVVVVVVARHRKICSDRGGTGSGSNRGHSDRGSSSNSRRKHSSRHRRAVLMCLHDASASVPRALHSAPPKQCVLAPIGITCPRGGGAVTPHPKKQLLSQNNVFLQKYIFFCEKMYLFAFFCKRIYFSHKIFFQRNVFFLKEIVFLHFCKRNIFAFSFAKNEN